MKASELKYSYTKENYGKIQVEIYEERIIDNKVKAILFTKNDNNFTLKENALKRNRKKV